MHKLLILSRDGLQYRTLIEKAVLPDLIFESTLSPEIDIVFGEPNLIKDALASLPDLIWVQANWAGVEPLLDPRLRRDYILTNARGVFGGLMSEYVFSYLLAHERRIFERAHAQVSKQWDSSTTGTLRGKTIGLLGVGAWVSGSRAGWNWGLSITGPSRSLLEAGLLGSPESFSWGAVMLIGIPLGSWASARLRGPMAWRSPA